MRLSFELHEGGCAMMRENLRRRFPDESPEARERRFIEWLHTGPGAEHGDAVGRPRHVPPGGP